jgi:hypothetical protein
MVPKTKNRFDPLIRKNMLPFNQLFKANQGSTNRIIKYVHNSAQPHPNSSEPYPSSNK